MTGTVVAAPARGPAVKPASSRPEPTRAAVLAAYRNAAPAPAMPSMAPPAAPAPAPRAPVAAVSAPALAIARTPSRSSFSSSGVLARAEMAAAQSGQNGNAPQAPANPPAPDLDAIADHVLERLRHELRDGRERLGFLLDDIR